MTRREGFLTKNSISYLVDVPWRPLNESASLFYWGKFLRDGQLSVSQRGQEISLVYEIQEFSILHQVYRFSSDFTKMRALGQLRAEIAHFAIVNIDFLLRASLFCVHI